MANEIEQNELQTKIDTARVVLDQVRQEIGKRIIGQKEMVDGLLMGIIAGGHVLLEGVPGLAKTYTIKAISEAISADFKRIQFTPDLLPADLTGTMIYRQRSEDFVPQKGPVFTNILLADEINRAPAKVQSALLESMEEKQVTIGEESYPLPSPFFVLATQNPLEQEGTYPLPEAQLDRFMLKLKISYPSPVEELAILQQENSPLSPIKEVLNAAKIKGLKGLAEMVKVDESLQKYIVSLVHASRDDSPVADLIEFGASPRATLSIVKCARVQALMEGRAYTLPEDIRKVVYAVMRHRIVLSYEAEAEEFTTDDVITRIVQAVPVP